MAFYGKSYSNFKLDHGDFLQQKHRPEILESTIVFVNNFAFGPEVDQHLKDIFADLTDGSRIFSSKSFCALNFRITDRNLSGKYHSFNSWYQFNPIPYPWFMNLYNCYMNVYLNRQYYCYNVPTWRIKIMCPYNHKH